MANYRKTAAVAPPPDTCLSLDWLSIAGRDPETCSVTLLGYPLLLSPAEARILWQTVLLVADPLGDSPAATDATVRSAVKRINEKARSLGGRDLLLADGRGSYRLNPYM